MLGLMQNFPLVIPKLLSYAEKFHAKTEIVSRRLEGDIHRYTYADLGVRARKLANALTQLGIKPGDVVGTIAWNGYRHMELYYALPGIQSLYHTINPRLSAEQLVYIINHAEDRYIFLESMFVPLLEEVKDQISDVKGFVILCDKEDMPETQLTNVMCYEEILEAGSESYEWEEFDENTACGICFTSGTTGNPKGVVYSHRALVLQAMSFAVSCELTCRDTILPIVPMFHVNAWTLPFVATLLGIKLVLPGKELGGVDIHQLLSEEQVSFAAGVPTVFLMLLNHLETIDDELSYLKKIVIGGSAAPLSMLNTFRNKYNVDPMHAWGMTETTALGISPSLTAGVVSRGEDAVMDVKMKQGHAVFGSEIKIIDEEGRELPMDGKSAGSLCIRGWAVASDYLGAVSRKEFLEDGWFETGDVATIDQEGYLKLTDRAKDMIKSGGEWISSIDLENAAMGHTSVSEAAVIGVFHPKWDERPLLILVSNTEAPDEESILSFMESKVAKWWLPDDIVFVEELPHGATGKVDKKVLREQFRDYVFAA